MSYPNGTHVSPHLAWSELACHDAARTPYPAYWRQSHAIALARAFEAIRAVVGRPILVLSAYRTREHNRRVGGARNSQHIYGRALDLGTPTGWTRDQFYQVIRGEAKHAGIRGLGKYSWGVHIDIRESERLIVWQGARAWAEVV